MANYIGSEKFAEWYNKTAIAPRDVTHVMMELYTNFCSTGVSEFTIPAEKSTTGKAESYKFRVENLGCCGASSMMVYF